MLGFPNAKINLGLQITRKRTDGYHDLNTIFLPIPYTEALEFVPAAHTTFESIGLPIHGSITDNLVMKAYDLLQRDFPQIPALKIILHKIIPMGAGLGGGSADGTFMLKMLNEQYALGLTTSELITYAIKLGSDCPFFVYNQPCFAAGRGELLEPMAIAQLNNYSLVLVLPNIHISTASAFKGVIPKEANYNLKDIKNLEIEAWKDYIYNDFEQSVLPQFSMLQGIKDQLYQQGAVYASLSGTGAAMYAFMPKGQQVHIENIDGQQLFFNDILVK